MRFLSAFFLLTVTLCLGILKELVLCFVVIHCYLLIAHMLMWINDGYGNYQVIILIALYIIDKKCYKCFSSYFSFIFLKKVFHNAFLSRVLQRKLIFSFMTFLRPIIKTTALHLQCSCEYCFIREVIIAYNIYLNAFWSFLIWKHPFSRSTKWNIGKRGMST